MTASPRRVTLFVFAALLLAGAACRPHGMQEPLPAIPVYEIAPTDSGRIAMSRNPALDPLAALGATRRISLTANNADARTLLLWLAQQAGVSLVVAPDVSARVSVNFNDVPAYEAMRAIIAETGLSLLTSGLRSPWPPVVFFHLPVNVNEVNADAIVARFGVSMEMAKWIVESRPKP
jgi:hypothetical protein